MALSEGDRAIVAAIELLRDRVTQLPLAIAQNAAMAADESNRQQAPAAQRPASQSAEGQRKAAGAADLLAARFAALLGPMAAFGTLLSAPTSGFSVFSKAMGLFAAAIAPVVLPALFLLASGLAAGSDAIFRKLVPSLEGFYRLVLQTGIPAVQAFADMVGRATSALTFLANSRLGRAVLSGDDRGGKLGALNRLTGGESGVESDAGSGSFADRSIAFGKRAQRGAADLLTTYLPFGGETASRGIIGLNKSIFGQDADPYSGRGVRRTGEPGGADEARRGMQDTLRELLLSVGPKASVGSVAGVYTRAATAAIGQSQFERRMLEMMQTVTTAISRAAGEPGPGVHTERPAAPRPGGR